MLFLFKKNLSLFLILLFCFILSSCLYHWDGAFPSVEYDFYIVDTSGRPVKDARLFVLRKGKERYKYPIEEFVNTDSLISDENGFVRVHHTSWGLEFGGTVFLFVFGKKRGPKFKIKVSARGYKNKFISYNKLTSSCLQTAENRDVVRKIKIKNKTIEHKYYKCKTTVVLKRDKK